MSTDDDTHYMMRALALAEPMRGRTAPNPAVGCVIVKKGEVVGEAATAPGGRPHAETQALDKAGKRAKGADIYVSLEPCAHHGVTPPCAEALVKAQLGQFWHHMGANLKGVAVGLHRAMFEPSPAATKNLGTTQTFYHPFLKTSLTATSGPNGSGLHALLDDCEQVALPKHLQDLQTIVDTFRGYVNRIRAESRGESTSTSRSCW